MFKKTLLFSAVALVLAVMTVATASALLDTWNRPNPLMDYVPQEVAIYDTRYDNLDELDCRACHGDSLADRHHYTEIVLRDRLCTPCHEIIPEPPGVVVIRDCTASGCHSWDDVYVNGWHHDTDLSASDNCVACHDRNVVAEILPEVETMAQYPPSVVTPTPFSCENCHWGRAVSDAQAGFDGTVATDHLAGHPSTFDHYNQWGQFIGYYEYNKDILHNMDTHHMGDKGNVADDCSDCHGNDPNLPSWVPTDPDLIRYCERCHDIGTLHTIYAHVGPPGTGGGPAVEGWEAVGFHVPGSVDGDPPTTYRGNGIDGFGASSSKWFEANEQCFGCHGDAVPAWTGDSLAVPVLSGVSPASACPGGIITLSGSNFGEVRTPGEDGVLLKGGALTTWQEVGVAYYSWTDDTVEIQIQPWELAPGNYNIKVFNETGASAKLTITVFDCVSPQEIYVNNVLGVDPTFNAGVCTNTISLQNPSSSSTYGFGNTQDQSAKGIYGVVQVSASQGNYVVKNYLAWNPTEVKFKFKTFFEDLDGDFIQDGDEPDILNCSDLALGSYYVYIKYIFYLDDDLSGGYTEGDTITQIESSNPVTFELENTPYINQLNPKVISKYQRLRILGINFGVTQTTGTVHVGTGNHYNLMVGDPLTAKGKIQDKIKKWSNTKVVVNFRVRNTWLGTKKWVWVVKDGMVSNARRVVINP